ncbi:uncharacterized protein LOC144300408 isoform X2 [Canis aureus]
MRSAIQVCERRSQFHILRALWPQCYLGTRSFFEGWLGKITTVVCDPERVNYPHHRKLKSMAFDSLAWRSKQLRDKLSNSYSMLERRLEPILPPRCPW